MNEASDKMGILWDFTSLRYPEGSNAEAADSGSSEPEGSKNEKLMFNERRISVEKDGKTRDRW